MVLYLLHLESVKGVVERGTVVKELADPDRVSNVEAKCVSVRGIHLLLFHCYIIFF